MADTDIRSLLRAERASRRITHPHAAYSTDGKLRCNLCETLVKSEAQWQAHLHSTQHVLRSQRAQEVKDTRGVTTGGLPGGGGKKRKAESLDSPRVDHDERKRVRASGEEITAGEAVDNDTLLPEDEPALPANNGITAEVPPSTIHHPTTLTPAPLDPTQQALLDAEFASLERDLAAYNATSQQPISALAAEATISAAPMTAEELAAQAREEQSAQRGKRDQEIEAEREDAERVLEEEFEVLEGLEERVRRLRERREELRVGDGGGGGGDGGGVGADEDEVVGNGGVDVDGEEESSESHDEEDAWGFGGS